MGSIMQTFGDHHLTICVAGFDDFNADNIEKRYIHMTKDSDTLRVLRQLALSGRNGPDQPVPLSRNVVATLIKRAYGDLFDEEWYFANNPDVAEAVRKKAVPSALDHFALSGIYEGRLPCAFPLDEEDYARRHQDVARSIAAGEFKTVSEHFFTIGFLEGRAFTLRA